MPSRRCLLAALLPNSAFTSPKNCCMTASWRRSSLPDFASCRCRLPVESTDLMTMGQLMPPQKSIVLSTDTTYGTSCGSSEGRRHRLCRSCLGTWSAWGLSVGILMFMDLAESEVPIVLLDMMSIQICLCLTPYLHVRSTSSERHIGGACLKSCSFLL